MTWNLLYWVKSIQSATVCTYTKGKSMICTMTHDDRDRCIVTYHVDCLTTPTCLGKELDSIVHAFLDNRDN